MAGAPVGNQNAAKAKRWQDALVKALARYSNDDGKIQAGQALDKIAEVVVMKALAGDKDSIIEIGNRLDGKPAQALIHQGDEEGGPVKVEKIERVIRRADAANRNG
jgi:hypothetical protein